MLHCAKSIGPYTTYVFGLHCTVRHILKCPGHFGALMTSFGAIVTCYGANIARKGVVMFDVMQSCPGYVEALMTRSGTRLTRYGAVVVCQGVVMTPWGACPENRRASRGVRL